jgi:Na+-transporting NADH:ubiquinone oxidoreductase subunit B
MTRGLWGRETVALLLVVACLPLAGAWLWYGGLAALGRLGLAALVLLIWNLVFLLVRAQPPSLASVITALAVAMLAPEGLGVFRLALGLSFGAVMGELVFGGWGRNVVSPATVALSFLGFGFPGLGWPDFVIPVAWAAIPTLLLGVGLGVMPAGIIMGAAGIGALAVLGDLLPMAVLPAATIVLALLVADPAVSATTAPGRWLNGALYAALLALFATGWSGAAPVQIAVAAALLASLAAPVLDEAALSVWVSRRRRRHGRS